MYNSGKFGVQTRIVSNSGIPSGIPIDSSQDLLTQSINIQNSLTKNMEDNKLTADIGELVKGLATKGLIDNGVSPGIAEALTSFVSAQIAGAGSSSNGKNDKGIFDVNKDLGESYIQDSAKYQFTEPSEPVPITLKTNIKPNHYKTAWNNGGDPTGTNPDLNISKFKLRLFGSTGTVSRDYSIFGPITNIQLQLSKRLNFAVPSTPTTVNAMISYFNAITEALLAYYHYDSIINFTSNPYNRNSGAAYLRNGITFGELQNLQFIKSILLTFPLPPKFVDLIWYLSQFYRSSDVNNSTLLKCIFFTPGYGALASGENYETNGFEGSTNLGNLITTLLGVRDTANLISKAFPEWNVTTLPGSLNSPLFDDQFNTFWTNTPEDVIVGASVTVRPATSSTQDSIQYSSYVEEVDGLIYSLASVNNTSSSQTGDDKWMPGILVPRRQIVPTASFWSNRSYFDSFNQVFRQAYGTQRAHIAAGYTHVVNAAINTTVVPFKAEQILGVSINTISDTVESFLDYIFQYNADGLSTMPSKNNYLNSELIPRGDKPKKRKRNKSNKPKGDPKDKPKES